MNKSLFLITFNALLLISLVSVCFLPDIFTTTTYAAVASASPSDTAAAQLYDLTPEERVGQLFLITFNGYETASPSTIHEYITQYHIGGVILERENDNFSGPDQMPRDCWELIQDLQTLEYDYSVLSGDNPTDSSEPIPSQYIPLFIGLSQEGNLSAYSEILTGLSPIPSQLSLGATWDPSLAELVGNQVGRELSVLGVNLLLGPSLDVISNPTPGQSDLGVRSYGGDPFWVGKFGQAFIKGVHNGSLNNVAVVAKYFPGLGSSDRLPEQEVATVRKSLEQLRQTDLAPFFAVTGYAPDSDSTADALLNSHIRYQGLQGNIRSTTRPISLDPQASSLLMDLDPLFLWRNNGGVIVSDNLGSQALQNLYDPTGQTTNIRQIALDAFIAGNDILYLGNYGPDSKPIPSDVITDTINFFTQKYNEDQNFADRVDDSVLRILTLKNSIYTTFNISTVLPSEINLPSLGISKVAELVARQSATLVNPEIPELASILQPSPTFTDRIVILSDTEQISTCTDCPPIATLDTDSLENAIVRLYGPFSGRQLYRSNITSYSFKDLTSLLDFPEESEQMVADLYNANWIIVASLDQKTDRPYSNALTRLLSERQDLLQNKKIILFALGAPYYLDATNISKISAFFALYNHLPSSLDVAARILFNEFPTFSGHLPVSVPGINYDLITATSPDPSIEFPIYVGEVPEFIIGPESPEATPSPAAFRIEDQVDLFTGVILDHNGNPVPDGTPVIFYIITQGFSTSLPQVTTISGKAQTSFFVESSDDITVYADSSLARSQTVDISIFGEDDISITQESQVSPTAEDVSPPVETTPEIDDPANRPIKIKDSPSLLKEWVLALVIILIISLIAYQAGSTSGVVIWGIRWFFSSLIGGLAAYNYLLLDLPGVSSIFPAGITRTGFLLIVASSALLGWLIGFLIQRVFNT